MAICHTHCLPTSAFAKSTIWSATIFVLILSSVRAQSVDEVTSLEGDWIVLFSTIDGRERKASGLDTNPWYVVDKEFSLYADGYGQLQNDNDDRKDLWWKYDRNTRTFKIKAFRSSVETHWDTEATNAKIERLGDGLKIKYDAQSRNSETNVTTVNKCEIVIAPTRVIKSQDRGAKVELDQKTFDRDDFTEEFATKPGIAKKVTLSRTFESSVTLTRKIDAELGGEAKIGNDAIGSLSTSMKLKIGASLGTNIGTKETFEELYELDGKNHTKLSVKWIKRYRTGVIVYTNGSKEAFEVFIGYRTIPEYPEDRK